MRIKVLVMDVDGTLTDGHIYISAQGEVMKSFDVKDGYAIKHILPELGIVPVIITGRESDIVKRRAKELDVSELYQGIADKNAILCILSEKYEAMPEEIAYIGDDLNDLSCIVLCGLSACPSDAIDEIKQKVKYICKNAGGRGAVREFIDYIQTGYRSNSEEPDQIKRENN